MKYSIRIYKDNEKIDLTYNQEEYDKFKKHIKSERYDGSFNMNNGAIAQIMEIN